MNIVAILNERARTRGEVPALLDYTGGRERRVTFATLDDATARAASMLEASGLAAGDAVLLFVPMSSELYFAMLGVLRSGMAAVFVDPSAGRSLIEHGCRRYAPRGFVGSPRSHLLRALTPALRRVPVHFTTAGFPPLARRWSRWTHHRPRDVVAVAPDAPALVTFTSGSTGTPKVAVRTHGFLLAQHDVLSSELQYAPDDRVLTVFPVFALSHLADGVAMVIPDVDLRRPGNVDAAPVIAAVMRDGVTAIEAPPAFLERVVAETTRKRVRLDGVRKILTGGAPVFPALLDRLQEMAPNAEVVALYGSTEAEPIAHVSRDAIGPDDVRAMCTGGGLLAGRPIGRIALRIMSEQGSRPVGEVTGAAFERVCLPAGAIGEVVVSGAHVLPGYYQGVGDGETKFRVDGTVWHRTGDAGNLDDKGRLWLMGRCSARVEDERGTVSPFAVECAAYNDPAVRRSAFLSRFGERILVVELVDRHDGGAVERLRAALEWAGVDRILTCTSIPVDKRHNSKVDYPALEKLIAREMRRQ